MVLGQAFFQCLIDNALEIILLFDASGKIFYGNQLARELLEYDFPRVLQLDMETDSVALGPEPVTICDVFPSSFSMVEGRLHADLDYSCFQETTVNQEELLEAMAYRKNRTCFPVNVHFCRCRQFPGVYICKALDASKQTYYERQATHKNQEAEEALMVKTQFVANVTHELRTPVNGILGNVRELSELEEDGTKRKYMNLIERGCNDMHAIINNILDFSKLDAGKFELESREFDFREMMDYVRSTHMPKITEKGLSLQMTISQDVPAHIIGDELRIQQILNNLLSNATKFTFTGTISVNVVKTSQIDNRAELFFMVMDTGIGIAKEDQDKLFKSFSQVEASTTRKFGGTGLGLNISKQLVELMEGNIHVESEKNQGTMFSFHIWVEIPQEELDTTNTATNTYEMPNLEFPGIQGNVAIKQYGTEENRLELQKKLSKLVLCFEMDNWEKAESFMESVKQLTMEAPQEVKSSVLRLKMAVQKEDYNKAMTAYNRLREFIPEEA